MINDTIKTIMNRRSIRTFKPDQVEEDKLEIMMTAAQYAPNAGGRQLWNFTIVQNKEVLENIVLRMVKALGESENKDHQKRAANPNYHTFYHAPTVIIVSGVESTIMIETDCAAATENMLLAAESLGLSTCWVGSASLVLSREDIKRSLGIPDGYKPLYAVSVGYNSSLEKIEPTHRKPNTVNYVR